MTIAATIKRLRTARGMSQTALARKTKVSQEFICKLETGVAEGMSIDTLRRLSKALGVSVADVVR